MEQCIVKRSERLLPGFFLSPDQNASLMGDQTCRHTLSGLSAATLLKASVKGQMEDKFL